MFVATCQAIHVPVFVVSTDLAMNLWIHSMSDIAMTPSAGSDSWCTPRAIADALGPFDLDPCSNARSHIRAHDRIQLEALDAPTDLLAARRAWKGDGLAEGWGKGSVFLNWPYSDPLPWARKVALHDGPWVVLAKLDPSTKWWAALMSVATTVAPFRKRIAFETDAPGKTMTANFPSVLVYSAWRPPRELVPYLWLPTYLSMEVR